MKEYHKIPSVFKRDPATSMTTFRMGEWSEPEFGYLANNEWVFTEKVDGTNIRIMIADGQVTFGGKTDNASIPAFLVEKLQQRFLPQKDALLAQFPTGGCLYGEGYGARIQKGGGNYRPDQDFVLFDVKVGDWWLQREAVESTARQFGLDVVPILGSGTIANLIKMVSAGFKSTWGDFDAEGIVARPAVELKTRAGHRIITKLKHRDFPASASAAAE